MKKIHFPERIVSDRILLKKHDLNLAETMFRYVDQDRERLGRFLPWVPSTKSLQDEVNYINMALENWENHELYDYGIFIKEGDCYIGNMGVHSIKWAHNCCELGYWILGQFEGKGFVREAVSALTNTCHDIGFNRVEIRCDPDNERSSNVPKSLGFRFEGCLSQSMVDQFGGYRDTLIFARLKSEGRLA